MHPKEKPSKGHYICVLCDEYIREELGEAVINHKRKTYKRKDGATVVYYTKRHALCKGVRS